jgi:hypothetical protein
MTCFTLGWLEQLLIWLVVIGAAIALVKLLIPLVVGPLGVAGATIVNALNIIIWAVVAIAVIVLVFDLLSCLVGVPRVR